MSEAILEMRGITKSFPGVKALSQVNLTLNKGEVLALIGENGAGKSTLMKILSGAYQADEGTIVLKGKNISIIVRMKQSGMAFLLFIRNSTIFVP